MRNFVCPGQCIIIIRYLIVEELNAVIRDDMNNFLNKISLALGGFSSVALIVVASYPVSNLFVFYFLHYFYICLESFDVPAFCE